MRFKNFMIVENSVQSIISMFGNAPAAAGGAQYGAQAAGAQSDPSEPATQDANEPNPALLSITGADSQSKSKVAMDALKAGFKQLGKDPAVMPMQMDQQSVVAAMQAAFQSGKANKNDQEGLSVFASTVSPQDVENVLGSERMKTIQAPQVAANAAAANAGAQMAQGGAQMAQAGMRPY